MLQPGTGITRNNGNTKLYAMPLLSVIAAENVFTQGRSFSEREKEYLATDKQI